jgi:AraC-like DNA-binding protein
MSSTSERGGVFAFNPPYDRLKQCAGKLNDHPVVEPGTAVVWRLLDAGRQESEFEQLRARACGLPLIVLLPPPSEIIATLPLLNLVPLLLPKGVLPDGRLATPGRLRAMLAAPPKCLSDSVAIYLGRRGVLPEKQLRLEVHRIFDLAPDVASISTLARRLYTSRRTLGRHLTGAGLPVPSHWLQFARLLHVAIQLQNDNATIFRVAARTGYPDGFTMSNQMKRLLGVRPTVVRRHLGWEWLVETWLMRELKSGRLDRRRYGLEWL